MFKYMIFAVLAMIAYTCYQAYDYSVLMSIAEQADRKKNK